MFKTDNDINDFLKYNVSSYGEFHNDALYQVLNAVNHIITNNIDGDLIEIGVYKGVMVAAMCAKLLQLGVTDRKIHLYDTFEGMVQPTYKDIYCNTGENADINNPAVKSVSPLENVKYNISLIDYPSANIIYHKGDICKTNLDEIPQKIAFLRLDTDWYESTKFELQYFIPFVSNNGVVTQDDYGWWKGASDAVNEYLSNKNIDIKLLNPHGIWWFNSV